ncbi:class C sortase [Streptococcus ictaluri]|uniref:Sortase family protein n=1 Tax=Streptococcus ictaluri 707-05 TaxID=764299 RepID=G5K4Q1_9STRE|nr:class C sortase [Streptococcus ictaluri]EHI69221.1 sortase family protein [Streptococcus ictaluri 707-05]
MKERLKNLGILLLFLIGVIIFLYPLVSSRWNAYRNQQLLGTYDQQIAKRGLSETEVMWEKAKAYNDQIGIQPVPDAFSFRDGIHDKNYESLLKIENNDIMGYVEVPSIKVTLPIYHYTTDEVLTKGAGHLFGSALPVGGDGTHTVISAHRGLPSSEMFTNLNLVSNGDMFYFRVLNKVLAYEVDQILTVEPDQVTSLSGVMGKDYATLVTCTPYGVNTKRLLVRGHRVPYHQKQYKKAHTSPKGIDRARLWVEVLCAGMGVIIAAVLVLIYSKISDKKNKSSL